MLLKIPCASFSSIMLVSQWIQVQVNVNGTKHSWKCKTTNLIWKWKRRAILASTPLNEQDEIGPSTRELWNYNIIATKY
jgi:hypothetical protein